jgi:hypothetical protein
LVKGFLVGEPSKNQPFQLKTSIAYTTLLRTIVHACDNGIAIGVGKGRAGATAPQLSDVIFFVTFKTHELLKKKKKQKRKNFIRR